jgi:BASS family bile acid:Na+ symporter
MIMSLVTILGLLIKLSLFLTVLSYGMLASWDDVMYLFRRPGQLIRALFSINVIMPIVMLLMALFFDLDPVVKVALIALAVSPVPPGLPGQLLKAGGSRAFTFGLLAAISLLSVITVPLVLSVFDRLTPGEVRLPMASIFQTVVTSAVVPIVIGMLIRHFAPAFAERVAGPLGKIAMIVLLVSFLPILIFGLLPLIWSVASLGTILGIIAFTVIGITVGHFLGGPDMNDRAALALATSTRHPAIAIAVAIANIGQTETKKAVAIILLYLLISGIVAMPYFKWLSGKETQDEKAPNGKVA